MTVSADILPGNVKVTRQDWLDTAKALLVSEGIESVKILTLAGSMGVSRSSFYWYFKDREELLQALLDDWLSTNTGAIVSAAGSPAETITGGVCNVFKSFIDPRRFDVRLDFAIRDWARRAPEVRRVLDTSDSQRIAALGGMFARFGYGDEESLIRARVLYYMQIGYNDADLQETMAERARLIPHYLLTFTGREGRADEIEEMRRFTLALEGET
ncbi:TetR/AcrR family transcriptional regulator [Silicimonas sp. MF1-12-2]|uniref:TetR/AcrR family transcriptional regulator n=1 Tax=Silicimonas sp. MF1-12-2 TaxID=3384793 RepID=UPI0039B670D2